MILTPEEQTEYREEIDYLIETHGYEYVWGKETTMDKVRAFSRDAPGNVIDSVTRFANNPTVIDINNKLAAHAAKINAQEAEQPRRKKHKKSQSKPQPQPKYHPKPQPKHQPDYDCPSDTLSGNNPFRNHPLGPHPLGEHPLRRSNTSRNQNHDGLHFGGDHL